MGEFDPAQMNAGGVPNTCKSNALPGEYGERVSNAGAHLVSAAGATDGNAG